MQLEELVYNGRDNTIALRLSSDGVTLKHTLITRCQLLIGGTLLDSNITPTYFDLTLIDRIVFKLGSASLTVGKHQATLYVFDAAHTNGVVWGSLVINVK